MVGLVAPFHGDHVARKLCDQLGAVHDDVAPELHRASSRPDELAYFLQEVEVDALGALLLARVFGSPETEIDSLVQAHVELSAGEIWEQLVVENAKKLEARRVR